MGLETLPGLANRRVQQNSIAVAVNPVGYVN